MFTPKHIQLKYRCPSNMSNQIGPTHLSFYLGDGGGSCVRKALMVEVGNVDVPILLLSLITHPYLSGMWLGIDQTKDMVEVMICA